MFNVGGPEVLVVILVALIVLGPEQLPKAMRTFGSVMSEIRKVSSGFQAEMRNAMDAVVDTSAAEKPQSGSMAAATPASPAPAATSSIEEVVVRNEGDPGADAPPAPAAGIDPADRAAG